MTLAAHVQELRTLALLDPETTTLQVAMINVLEELAEAVDGLRGRAQGDAGI
jgi:hypothetical protein